MRIARHSLLALALVPLLSSCVAALLPLAALGTMGKTQVDRAKAKRELVAAGAVEIAPTAPMKASSAKAVETSDVSAKFTGQGGGLDVPEVELSSDSADYLSRFFKPIDPQQPQPYLNFTNYALAQARKSEAGEGVKSVVLVPRVDIIKPQTVACMGKPMAVLIDLDDKSGAAWATAETLYRQNGLIEALAQLRESKISIIWLSDEPEAASARIMAILKEAQLSVKDSADFLFLHRGTEDRKQARRWDAARNYCILAIAGDERADFDELYDYLRHPDGAITLEHMFGAGWFIAPPPFTPDSGDKSLEKDEG